MVNLEGNKGQGTVDDSDESIENRIILVILLITFLDVFEKKRILMKR